MNEKKKEYGRMIKFFFFSTSAGLIEAGSFGLMEWLTDLPYWPCYLVSLILSVIWNFTLNRRYTFQSAKNVPLAMVQVAAFHCVFAPIATIGGQFLVTNLGWNEIVVKGLTMVINLVTEYLYQRFVVFGKSIDTNDRAEKQDKKAE